jgi:hypothetical protein
MHGFDILCFNFFKHPTKVVSFVFIYGHELGQVLKKIAHPYDMIMFLVMGGELSHSSAYNRS